jgi:hypothetical protein
MIQVLYLNVGINDTSIILKCITDTSIILKCLYKWYKYYT